MEPSVPSTKPAEGTPFDLAQRFLDKWRLECSRVNVEIRPEWREKETSSEWADYEYTGKQTLIVEVWHGPNAR